MAFTHFLLERRHCCVMSLVDILRQADVMEQIPEVNRANFAKHLTITKLKLENAIAIMRAGGGSTDEG